MWKIFSKKSKSKSYVFYSATAVCLGDKYEYTIEAGSRDEALCILLEFFFGKDMTLQEKVSSKSWEFSMPGRAYTSTNLPFWFYRRISGSWDKEDNDELIKFAKAHNLQLRILED